MYSLSARPITVTAPHFQNAFGLQVQRTSQHRQIESVVLLGSRGILEIHGYADPRRYPCSEK